MLVAMRSVAGCLLQFHRKVGALVQISQLKGAWRICLTWGQLMNAVVDFSCLESSPSNFDTNLRGFDILENYRDFSTIFPTLRNLLTASWLLQHGRVLWRHPHGFKVLYPISAKDRGSLDIFGKVRGLFVVLMLWENTLQAG